ncbi:heat shock protein beta-7 [Aplochiton taeniatus]
MASRTSSSSSRSSSSYQYRSSSSFRAQGPTGSEPETMEPFLEPPLPGEHDLFGEERHGVSLAHCKGTLDYAGPPGGAVTGRPGSMGVVRALGDRYFLSADVSQFDPHDVVVMAYNHNVVIHAEKVLEDGSVSATFTHKSLLPEDMDPLSVSGSLTPEGMLLVSVRRQELPPPPAYRSEAHL